MFASLCAAAAETVEAVERLEKEAPLIDIDGTVLVQFGIFCVMAAVLYALVFKPYLKVRDDREHGIGGARADARSMDERVAKLSLEVEAQVQRARLRGADERQKLRAEGAAYERQVLGAARDASQRAVTESRARVATERESARAQLLAEAQPLAQQVAARLLGRSVA